MTDPWGRIAPARTRVLRAETGDAVVWLAFVPLGDDLGGHVPHWLWVSVLLAVGFVGVGAWFLAGFAVAVPVAVAVFVAAAYPPRFVGVRIRLDQRGVHVAMVEGAGRRPAGVDDGRVRDEDLVPWGDIEDLRSTSTGIALRRAGGSAVVLPSLPPAAVGEILARLEALLAAHRAAGDAPEEVEAARRALSALVTPRSAGKVRNVSFPGHS